MASISINHVILAGHLTRDPESRMLPSGDAVCSLRLAVNNARQDRDGAWHQKGHFFDIDVYGQQGEKAASCLHKGEPVCVDGRLDWREWNTSEDQRVEAVKVVARNVHLLGRAPIDGAGDRDGESAGVRDDDSAEYIRETLGLAV